MKKVIKIAIVIVMLTILLQSTCHAAGSDAIYNYLYSDLRNGPIQTLREGEKEEKISVLSEVLDIWCNTNGASVTRATIDGTEQIVIKYADGTTTRDIDTIFTNIEKELMTNETYATLVDPVNGVPQLGFYTNTNEFREENERFEILNDLASKNEITVTPDDETNTDLTPTLPDIDLTQNQNTKEPSEQEKQAVEDIYNYLCPNMEDGNSPIFKLTTGTAGSIYDETSSEQQQILIDVLDLWCKGTGAELAREQYEGKEQIVIKYQDGSITRDIAEIFTEIEMGLRQNENYQKLMELSPVNNFYENAIKYLADNERFEIINGVYEENGGTLTEGDRNNSDLQDDSNFWGDMFQKAMDALLGIALYPLKAIILALGGIFNLIIDGIASIGGATNGIISLQDIIYTTTTKSAKAGINPVPIVAIDFFNFDNNVTTEIGQIRQGIANWFYVFRNLSIVISLCILIYTGIRMAISSIAEDKAKYKSMITNWFVQMVLVFFMQYIIFFTIGVNNAIVDALNPVLQNDTTNYMAELYKQAWNPLLTVGFGSAIVYCILLGMTFSFLIIYIKRMITIGFLIIISPLVTVTYAIDKMGDSKSQALNTWLKEFVYNILIQPFHCVIYAVFVSTAMTLLTVDNIGNFGAPVFAILCIMFMNKAEDILRKIFAFDKHAKTLGSGLASAAMIGAGLSTVSSLFKKEESTKKTGDAGAMPNIEATHKSYVEQKNIDNQIDEAQQASDKAADKMVQNNNGIQKTARQIEKDRRKNRAIESWQNAGGIGGMAMKGAQMQAKAALPVLSAFLGAGQGNLKSMIGAGTAGYAIERGIENAVEKRAKPSQVELSRQAKANEAALGVIYQEQAQKWTKEGGRWAGFSKEEILNDIKYLATMDNINELKKEDERHFAHVLQEGVSSYAALGQNMPVGDLVEFIRRQQG